MSSNMSIQGGQPVIPSSFSSSQGAQIVSNPFSRDTLISLNGQQIRITDPRLLALIPPDTFLVGDSVILDEALSKHRREQAQNETSNNKAFSTLSRGLIDKAFFISEISAALSGVSSEESAIYTSENNALTDMKAAIADYNNTIQNSLTPVAQYNAAASQYADIDLPAWQAAQTAYDDAVALYNSYTNPTPQQTQDYNDAVAAYNSAQSTFNTALTTFNTAITDYNSYVTSTLQVATDNYHLASQAFHDSQDAVNNAITAANVTRVSLDIPPIPIQNQNPPAVPTFSEVSPTTASETSYPGPVSTPTTLTDPLQLINISSNSTGTQSLVSQIINSLIIAPQILDILLNVAQNINQSRKNNTGGIDPLGDNSFISRHHRVSALSITNAGGGAALGQMSGKISQGVANEQLLAQAISTAFNIINSQSQFLAAIRARAALQSESVQSAQGQQTLSTLFGVTNGEVVQDLILSDQTRKVVEIQVKNSFINQNIDQKTVDDLVEIATARLNQELIKVALGQQGIAIGSPGLYGQFFASQAGLTSDQVQALFGGGLSLNEVLNDPQKQLFIKSTLSEQILNDQGKLDRLGAEGLANKVIDALVLFSSKGVLTDDDIKRTLLKTFAEEGVKEREASKLANKTFEILKAERASSDVLYAQVFNPAILEDLLQQEGLGNGHRIAQKAIHVISANSFFVNNTEFQIALQDELIKEGVKGDIASKVSEQLVIKANTTPGGPLSSSTLSSVLSVNGLTTEFHQAVLNNLGGLPPIQAEEVANQAVSVYIKGSKPSLLELYTRAQTTLETQGKTKDQELKQELTRHDLQLTFQQQMMLDKYFEPSKLFLTFGLSDFGSPQHKWDKKGIDAPI